MAIHNQGLTHVPAFDEGIAGTQQAIEHLGYVQIDTISVVERAHHHILWNRVPAYDQSHLNQLIANKTIFEYWYHAAAYLPMCDYRYALPRMQSIRNGESHYFSRGEPKLMQEIMSRVKAEGAIKLRNLDQKTKTDQAGWWNFGPARRSIEQLYMQGDLMIAQRNGMEKVFDLAERCLPDDVDLSMPTLQEYADYLFTTTMRAHGVFTWKQLLHLRLGKEIREVMRRIILEHIDAGLITEHKNQQGDVFYSDAQRLAQLFQMENKVNQSAVLKIISPFDNLIIHRDRLNALFNYDYKLECYVPVQKRVFGYFCLPILCGDRLVARIDCKAYREQRIFKVINLYFENDKIDDKTAFLTLLNIALEKFAQFNGCDLANGSLIHF